MYLPFHDQATTTTVGTPDGFVPATMSLGPNKRRGLNARVPPGGAVLTLKNGKPSCVGKPYPTTVTCSDHVSLYSTGTIGVVGTKSTTTAPSPVSTITVITSTTSTSTMYPPHVTSTETDTVYASTMTTITTTVYTDTTTTSTQSIPGATTTLSGVCNIPDNFFGGTSSGIYGAELDTDIGSYSLTSASSAADCCNQCISNGQCANSLYISGEGPLCVLILVNTGTCSTGFKAYTYVEDSGVSVGSGYIVSNNICGYGVDGQFS